MATRLFVGSLSYSVNDDQLKEAFEAFGTVVSAKVIVDRDTNRSKGFGFVEMGSEEEAQAAIRGMDGKDLAGRSVAVPNTRYGRAYATGRAATVGPGARRYWPGDGHVRVHRELGRRGELPVQVWDVRHAACRLGQRCDPSRDARARSAGPQAGGHGSSAGGRTR